MPPHTHSPIRRGFLVGGITDVSAYEAEHGSDGTVTTGSGDRAVNYFVADLVLGTRNFDGPVPLRSKIGDT